MKKKIFIGLAVYSLLFLLMGLCIVYKIQVDTGKLNDLIQLHQVEILRERFLIRMKRVQSDLLQKNYRSPEGSKAMAYGIIRMQKRVDLCLDCHHPPAVQAGIDDIRKGILRYHKSLDRLVANSWDGARLAEEEGRAFRDGEALIEKVTEMVAFTNNKLKDKTGRTLGDIRKSRNLLYLMLAIGPLLSLGLAGVFIGGFSKSVSRLLEATRTLKSGNLDFRVEGLRDEFGELATSFNEMAGSIRDQMRRMQETERTLEKANRDLRLAQEQMVKTETMAALGTLSTGISHEISTPLNTILHMAHLMRDEARDRPGLLSDIEVVEAEANEAVKVTRSFLGFARSARFVKEPVDVNRILEELFKIIEFQRPAKPVRLDKRLAPSLRAIHVNSGKIRQVLLNVILNAIQAMPDGGDLRVRTANGSCDGTEGVEIAVEDTGSGIPQEDLERIFHPFFTTKENGTGIGLAISHGIVQEHRGRIAVESEIGRGTVFRIFLPEGEPMEAAR